MRRPLLLVAATLAAAALLAACGDDTTSTADSTHMNDDTGSMDSGSMGSGSMGSGSMGQDGHGESSPVAEGARRIEVTARSFDFEPAEITVQAGEDIAIVLTSEDLLHDFTIDEIDAHVAADAGDTAEGGLRADEPGRYAFYCTVAGHRAAGMEGTLVVE